MTTDTAGQNDGNRIYTGSNPGIDLSGVPGLQDIQGQTVTFRLYGWGDGGAAAATNTVALGRSVASTGNIGGPLIQGTISQVPEASAFAFLGVALGVGLVIKLKRHA
jgi:hypothetical protein